MISSELQYIIKSVILVGFLVFFTIEDIKYRQVSNRMILIMMFAGIVAVLCSLSFRVIMMSFVCAAFSAAICFIAEKLSRGGLGRGDTLIIIAEAIFIGDLSFLTIIFITMLLLSIFSGIGLLFKKISMKTRLPLIPFLLAGTVIGSII